MHLEVWLTGTTAGDRVDVDAIVSCSCVKRFPAQTVPKLSNNPNFSNNPYVNLKIILLIPPIFVSYLQKRAHCLAIEVRGQRTMEKLSKMTLQDLQEWLLDKEMPMEVAESFEGGNIGYGNCGDGI